MISSTDRAVVAERTKAIVDLHLGIEASLRRSVQDAIRLGELLTEQKEALPHGEFLPWIERELPFSASTAERYMGLHRHCRKIVNVTNLQDAYRIAQIEDQRQRPKARPVDPETVEKQRKRHEDFVKRLKDKPAPPPRERTDYEAVLKEAHEAMEQPAARPVMDALASGDGPVAVAGHLADYIDAALALLPDELSRHQVINALIKRLREKSVALNRKAGAA